MFSVSGSSPSWFPTPTQDSWVEPEPPLPRLSSLPSTTPVSRLFPQSSTLSFLFRPGRPETLIFTPHLVLFTPWRWKEKLQHSSGNVPRPVFLFGLCRSLPSLVFLGSWPFPTGLVQKCSTGCIILPPLPVWLLGWSSSVLTCDSTTRSSDRVSLEPISLTRLLSNLGCPGEYPNLFALVVGLIGIGTFTYNATWTMRSFSSGYRYGFIFVILIILFNGFTVFLKGNWNTSNFFVWVFFWITVGPYREDSDHWSSGNFLILGIIVPTLLFLSLPFVTSDGSLPRRPDGFPWMRWTWSPEGESLTKWRLLTRSWMMRTLASFRGFWARSTCRRFLSKLNQAKYNIR